MKVLTLLALVIRVAVILSLLGGAAPPLAHTQVSFLQPLMFQGGTSEVDADFNRDGKLDIATPGTLLLGYGDGTFKTPINLSVSGNLVATADFNDDGNPDLLIASTQSTVLSVLLGNGDGTFQPAKSSNVGISFGGLAVADVNGDGKPDLLGVVVGGQVFVFLGNGDGTFKAGVPYSAGPNPYLMVTGDFNGDGKVDIATADGYPAQIAVMLGNGDGTFQSPVISTGVIQPFDMTSADVNDDGTLDLIIADNSTVQTYTFLGIGDGTFQAAIVAAPAGSPGVGDVNGDGKPDLILNTQYSFITEILLGNGDGTFTYARAYASQSGGDSPVDILTADFNNDGKLDLVVGDTMLLGNGNGTFRGQPVTLLPTSFAAVAGDFNGDGNPDLAVTSSTDLNILLGDGAGAFAVAHTYSASGNSIATGDLNDDGKLDLAITTADPAQDWSLTILLGNGDGTFGPPTVYQQGMASGSLPVLIADLRADQKPYVLTVQGDFLVVFPNNGDGTFGTPISYFAGSAANGVAVADFNGDGKLDAGVSSSAGIGILLGNGDGTFQGATFTATEGNAFSIETGDFNNDGKADLVIGFLVFLGNGNGTFTALPESLASVVVGVADFNGDGNLDLLEGACPFSTAQFSIWCVQLGIGNGTFGNPITVTTSSDMTSGFNVIADFNRDQTPDIAIDLSPVLNSSPGGVFVLLNTTPPAPGATVSPSALNFPSQVAATSSSPASVILSNTGKGVLTLSGIKVTGTGAGDFSQTNNCSTVQPGATCTIKVVFAPTAAGNAAASLSVTDNAVGSPQSVGLSGTATAAPPDFAIGPASGSLNSATVTPGQAASFNLTVSPAGSFSGTVSLSCAITPAVTPAPVCTVPASINVTQGAAAPVAVKVSTTASGTSAGSISSANFPTGVMPVSWTMLLLASGLLFAGYRGRIRILGIPVIAVAFLAFPGCGGGGSSSSITTPGTPAGTYTATVTAKSGSLSHNTALTVIVQ